MAQRLFNPFFVHTCRDIICGMLYRFRGVAHGNSNSRVSQHVEVVFRIAKRHAFQPRETEAREKAPHASRLSSGLVPNDASNTARAYVLLQKIGWITLDSGVDPSAVTQDDIVENPKNLEFVEMKSLTIPAAIQDFDYVIITGSIVYNAGIDPSAVLATEDILDHLILQVVVKEGNKNADWAQAIVDAYHSDRFKAYLEENNDGLWWVPEELQ